MTTSSKNSKQKYPSPIAIIFKKRYRIIHYRAESLIEEASIPAKADEITNWHMPP
jgi:hypothetical protein